MVHRGIRAGTDGADCPDDEPKSGTTYEYIAEAIEMWEEKVHRLVRHGEDYNLSEAVLAGKIKDNFELRESDWMPFEEILRRVKDQARAKKLEKDAQRGRSGTSLGTSQANTHQYGQEFEAWGGPASPQAESGSEPQEPNSAQKGKEGKAKGKGKDGKGKGKGDGNK